MVKLATKKVEKKMSALDAFTNNIKVDLKKGRITSANIVIAKIDVDEDDTIQSVKEWIKGKENTSLIQDAFSKYEKSCAKRRSTLKANSQTRKNIKSEVKTELLRQRIKENLTKAKKTVKA